MGMNDQIRILRALGTAYREEGENAAPDPMTANFAFLMGDAHLAAADQLEQEERAATEALAAAHRCTIDHARMTVTVCPACGAKRG